jgi:ArsR family transcriptional regulator
LDSKYDKTATIFKALSDTNRLMIVDMLFQGEMCACQLLDELNISQSTLSHHMKSLCDAGIVNGRKEGKWMYYSINNNDCEPAHSLLTQIINTPVQSNVNSSWSCN